MSRTIFAGPAGAAGDGSRDKPFSLTGARDGVRRWKQAGAYPPGGVEVRLLPGDYGLTASLAFAPRDSGLPDAPVVWRADEPGTVRVHGGLRLPAGEPVTDAAVRNRLPAHARDAVRRVDLRAAGLSDFGKVIPRGHGGGSGPAGLELFAAGEPLTPARWPKKSRFPNRGFEAIAEVRGNRLVYTDPRPAGWSLTEEVYAHGFFSRDWASTIVRVVRLDAARRELELDPPHAGPYHLKAGGRFFYFNVLEELGEPGEWVLDRAAGVLYLWPPEDGAAVEASVLEPPLFAFTQVEDVRVEGLSFAVTRGDAVAITGGRRLELAGCAIANVGRAAVRIKGGWAHVIRSCDIWNTGESGVEIHDAGDRRHGEPAGHVVENGHLHHIAREAWTYSESVRILNSCGVTVRRNLFHDHPHAMIHYRGNDHRIEGNEFYNFTLLGDDCGCMYYGRDFTLQGHVVHGNYLHHAGDSGRNDWGSVGVYNDDGAGGTEVCGNTMHHVNKGVLAGGGINSRIHHNLFSCCEPAVWFDERLASAQADRGDTMMHGWMRGLFYDLEGHRPPFSARYPGMDAVHDALQRGVGLPPLNAQVRGNMRTGQCGPWLMTHWAEFPDYFDHGDNIEVDPAEFPDRAFGLFELPPDHPACRAAGFAPVRMADIGLYRDAYRRTIESVWTALEVVRPVGSRGEPGRVRLRLRNTGDVPVRGVEYVEIKKSAHGPGFAHAAVPFESPPGGETAVEFEVAPPPVELAGCYTLHLHTRGERIRPAWAGMAVACRVETELETLEAPVWGAAGGSPGRVRLRVRNRGGEPVTAAVGVTASPAAGVSIEGGAWRGDLAPGAGEDRELRVRTAEAGGALVSRITLCTGGPDVKPAQARLTVRYPLPRLARLPALEAVERELAAAPLLTVKNRARNARTGHYGDFRLAVAEGQLVVAGRVFDPRVAVTPLLWDGSCVEVFACNPDRERIGHVFGNIEIGQVYLVPADGGEPARGYRFRHNAAEVRPGIRVATRAEPDGYALSALVPLEELALDPAACEFLFEMQVSVGRADREPGESRGTLFGSETAFNDTGLYARAVV